MIAYWMGLGDAAAQNGPCVTNPLSGCSSACLWAPGSSLDYELWGTSSGVNLPMDALHIEAVVAAAGAWRFGSNQRMRGANWQFVSVSGNGSWALGNLDNEVVLLPDAIFEDLRNEGDAPTDAFMQPGWYPSTAAAPNTCGRKGMDLLIREHPQIYGE